MQYQDDVFSLTKDEAKALLAFASTDEARLALNTVRFGHDTGEVVACNGHTIVVVTATTRDALPDRPKGSHTLVPASALKDAIRLLTRKTHFLHVALPVSSKEGAVLYVTPDPELEYSRATGEVRAPAVEAEYPPYEQIIHHERLYPELAVGRIGIAIQYLANLKLIGNAAGVYSVDLRVPEEDLHPIEFAADAADGTAWYGCIMPVRLDKGNRPKSVATVLGERDQKGDEEAA